jgi:hypothetical protein
MACRSSGAPTRTSTRCSVIRLARGGRAPAGMDAGLLGGSSRRADRRRGACRAGGVHVARSSAGPLVDGLGGLKRPWPDGRTELVLPPVAFLRTLCGTIPPPRPAWCATRACTPATFAPARAPPQAELTPVPAETDGGDLVCLLMNACTPDRSRPRLDRTWKYVVYTETVALDN